MLHSLVFFVFASNSFAAGPPALSIPAEWRECKVPGDCAIAGDACRSCGDLFVIHKARLEDFRLLDAKVRKAAGFAAACEACGTKNTKLVCEAGLCGYLK